VSDPVDLPTESTLDRVFRRARIIGVVVVGLGVLYLLRDLAQLVLAGALLAYVLNPLVVRLEEKTSRNWATAIVFVSLIGIIATGATLLAPAAVEQLREMEQGIDTAQVQGLIDGVGQQLDAFAAIVGSDSVGFAERVQERLRSSGDALLSAAPNLVSLITNTLLVPFIAVFLLRDGPQIKRGLIRLVPNRYFEFSLDALHKTDQQLGRYFRGLVLDIMIVAVIATTALWSLGVEAYALLGVIAGLANVIPYVGSILGGSIAAVVTLLSTGSTSLTGAVILAFIGIQVLDEVFIQPLLLSQVVDLHPLEIVLSVAVASQFFGIIGMVLAVPVASASKVVLTEGFALIQQYRFD